MTRLSEIAPEATEPEIPIRLRGVEVTLRFWGSRPTEFEWWVPDINAIPEFRDMWLGLHRPKALLTLTPAEIAAVDRIVESELTERCDRWREALRERRRRNGAGLPRSGDGDAA